MDPILGAAAINAGSSLLGGMMGSSGGVSVTKSLALMDAQRDRAFKDAETMPKHMVRGAKNAGIHPALLFGSPSFSPTVGVMNPVYEPGSNVGPAIAGMGQDISRAYMAHTTQKQREAEMEQLQLRQANADALAVEAHRSRMATDSIERQFIEAQIRKLNQQASPPAPSSTGGHVAKVIPPNTVKSGQFQMNPSQITSSDPMIQSVEAGPAKPAMQSLRIGGPNYGFNIELPAGSSTSESLESMGSLYSMGLVSAHQILRAFDTLSNGNPKTRPNIPLPDGYTWHWNPLKQAYTVSKKGQTHQRFKVNKNTMGF